MAIEDEMLIALNSQVTLLLMLVVLLFLNFAAILVTYFKGLNYQNAMIKLSQLLLLQESMNTKGMTEEEKKMAELQKQLDEMKAKKK
jgi:hypothetical protein